MPTSGVTTWSLTALQICTYAAQELGVLSSGEELTADEQADMMVRLTAMLKSWSVKANLFREATTTATITADTASVALPQGVREINAVRLVISADNERPLGYWNRGQYYAIPNRAASGDPTVYHVEEGIGALTLYVWPVPTANKTVKIDYSRSAEIVTDGAQTLDIAQEWQEAVYKNLAVRCANMFGTARLDPATLQKLAAEASDLYTQLLDADRPDVYVFEPYDGYYG